MADGPIAVTGATGAVGGRVAALLADRDQPCRLLVRGSRRAPETGAEVATIRGYRDGPSVERALTGCTTLFLVSGRESADRVSEHRSVVDAAARAGVRRIVYLSFQGAAADCTFTFGRDHWHTEQHIRRSAVDGAPVSFVFLRDSFYLWGLAQMAGVDGVIRGPAGDGAVAAVSHEDVAAVAAAVLLDSRWDGQTLDVTGPVAVTLTEVARALTRASGRSVRYVPETEAEAYASRASFAAPLFEVTGWVSSYQAIAAGEVDHVSDTVERVTGRPPIDLHTFLRRHPESFRHLTR